jgi:hypothetical protein
MESLSGAFKRQNNLFSFHVVTVTNQTVDIGTAEEEEEETESEGGSEEEEA